MPSRPSRGDPASRKPSSSTLRRRKDDAELQALYDQVKEEGDTLRQVEHVVTQLTLDAASVSSSPNPPYTPPPAHPTHSTHIPLHDAIFGLRESTDEHRAAVQEQLESLDHASQVLRDARAAMPHIGQTLTFIHDPRTTGTYRSSDHDGTVVANSGLSALRPDAPANALVLKHESNLVHVLAFLLRPSPISNPVLGQLRETVLSSVRQELDRLDLIKKDEWERQRHGIPSQIELHQNVVQTGMSSIKRCSISF